MSAITLLCTTGWPVMLAMLGPMRLWYAVPLVVSVSLVCAATRHEEMRPILIHAARFALWIIVFMGIVLVFIQLLTWLQ
jgi:hypothetical protein